MNADPRGSNRSIPFEKWTAAGQLAHETSLNHAARETGLSPLTIRRALVHLGYKPNRIGAPSTHRAQRR